MLLSGVQTIPEQLPLILTEGDAEDHESLAIIDGNEQLQVSIPSTFALTYTITFHCEGVNIMTISSLIPSS
jgi:glutamine cyclotransferase